MENNEKILIVTSEDPKVLYLYGLGKAISNLTQKSKDGEWFNSDYEYQKRIEMLDDVHKKAMEVISTIK